MISAKFNVRMNVKKLNFLKNLTCCRKTYSLKTTKDCSWMRMNRSVICAETNVISLSIMFVWEMMKLLMFQFLKNLFTLFKKTKEIVQMLVMFVPSCVSKTIVRISSQLDVLSVKLTVTLEPNQVVFWVLINFKRQISRKFMRTLKKEKTNWVALIVSLKWLITVEMNVMQKTENV